MKTKGAYVDSMSIAWEYINPSLVYFSVCIHNESA